MRAKSRNSSAAAKRQKISDRTHLGSQKCERLFGALIVFQILPFVRWSRTLMAGTFVTSAAIRRMPRIRNTSVDAPSVWSWRSLESQVERSRVADAARILEVAS